MLLKVENLLNDIKTKLEDAGLIITDRVDYAGGEYSYQATTKQGHSLMSIRGCGDGSLRIGIACNVVLKEVFVTADDVDSVTDAIQRFSNLSINRTMDAKYRNLMGVLGGLFGAHEPFNFLPLMFQSYLESQIASLTTLITLSGPRHVVVVNELNGTPVTLEQSITMSPLDIHGRPIQVDNIERDENPSTTMLLMMADEYDGAHRMLTGITALNAGQQLDGDLVENVFFGTLFDVLLQVQEMLYGEAYSQ